MTTDDLATSVLALVGGPANVERLTHCVSRLRFVLTDPDQADDAALQSLDGVVMVIRQSGQVQVAVRSGLMDLHAAVAARLG